MKRLNKVHIEWSSNFAYAIGIITTDGNLSNDGRHINVTSKDEEIIDNIKDCLKIKNKTGRKARGGSKIKKYFVIQFGDKNFYEFLLNFGLCPAKSKNLGTLEVPDKYFADFLRGCIDGDGSIGAYRHPESQYLQLRVRLCSASPRFLRWAKIGILRNSGIQGGWIEEKTDGVSVLAYAKADSLKLLQFMYYRGVNRYLKRKYQRAEKFLGRVAESV